MLNQVDRGYEKSFLNLLYFKTYRYMYAIGYKCTAILHTPMGRTHGENSMSKLLVHNDAKRVANTYTCTYIYGIKNPLMHHVIPSCTRVIM